MWNIIKNNEGEFHITPKNDLRMHLVDRECWCAPEGSEGIWLHNSLDHRELKKRAQDSGS